MENEYLKKGSVFRPGSPVADSYEFIDSCRLSDAKYAYPVKKMCAWPDVSASGVSTGGAGRARPPPVGARSLPR